MEYLDTYQQNFQLKKQKRTIRSSYESEKDALNELIQCQKEISALNKKLFFLCKNYNEQRWLRSKGLLFFSED